MAEKRVSVRLAAVGGKQVRAELEGVGDAGARGFGRMSREAEEANARLSAFATRVKIAAGVAVAAAVAAGVAMVKSGLETIDAQANLAQSLGTTTRSIQVLAFAGDLAGVSMDEIAAASKKLTLKLSEAAGGTGTAIDALQRLHLSATDLQALPLDERIATIQDAMAKFVAPTERAAVASALFGDKAALAFSRIDSATLRQASQDITDFGVAVPSAAITAFDQPLGTGDGVINTFQLKKLYTSGGQTWTRTILKPVVGTVQAGILTLQGPELLSSGSNLQSVTWSNTGALGANSAVTYGSFTAAYDLGTSGAGLRQHASVPVQQGKKYRAQVWFKASGSPDARLNLRMQPGNLDSGIKGTFAAPTIFNQNGGAVSNLVITDLGGGFWLWSFDIVVGAGLTGCLLGAGNSTVGQIVTILGASLREPAWTGPAPGWTADMSTGIVTFLSPPSVGANLTAGFEFDVPVRFDTDDLPVTLDIERIGSITSIPLIEVRR